MKAYGVKRNWDSVEAFSSKYRRKLPGKSGDSHPFMHKAESRHAVKRIPKKQLRAAFRRELRDAEGE